MPFYYEIPIQIRFVNFKLTDMNLIVALIHVRIQLKHSSNHLGSKGRNNISAGVVRLCNPFIVTSDNMPT